MRSPTPQQMAWIASVATLHSASPSCVTPACGYDQITPGISKSSLRAEPGVAERAAQFKALALVGLLSVRDGLEDFTGIDVLLGVLDFGPLLDLNPEPACYSVRQGSNEFWRDFVLGQQTDLHVKVGSLLGQCLHPVLAIKTTVERKIASTEAAIARPTKLGSKTGRKSIHPSSRRSGRQRAAHGEPRIACSR